MRRTSPAEMPAVMRVKTSSAASSTVRTTLFLLTSGCTAIQIYLLNATNQEIPIASSETAPPFTHAGA
jgi:hypothetical protein